MTKAPRKKHIPRFLPGIINILVVAGLLYAVTFLPPDTSLAEVEKAGILRVCVPTNAPPLVTGDAEMPGYDIEILQHLAQKIGVRLLLNPNPAIGEDFNPRNWRVTRSRCSVIAGGVVDTPSVRGFLQVLPTGIETGWVAISMQGQALDRVQRVAVLPGGQGLDRLQLSGYLREKGIAATPVRSGADLLANLERGDVDAAITDRFTFARFAAQADGARLLWMPEPPFPHLPLAFGIWKGDVTLIRALRDGLDALRDDGTLAEIAERYGLDDVPEEAGLAVSLFN